MLFNGSTIMTEFRRILCPVDFSQCSRDALDCAIGLARHHTARVLVLHVFANWPTVAVIPSLNADSPGKSSLRDVDRDELLRCLERFVKDQLGNQLFETEPNDGLNSGSIQVTSGTTYFLRVRATDNAASPYLVDLTLV